MVGGRQTWNNLGHALLIKQAKIWPETFHKCNLVYKTHIFAEKHNFITYYWHTSKLLFQDFTIWQPDLNLQGVVECFKAGIVAELLALFLNYVHSYLDDLI